MSLYTMRPSNLGAPPGEDFIFSYDGVDAGRCYLRGLTGGEQKWWWTIYIGLGPGTPGQEVQGVPIQGAPGCIVFACTTFAIPTPASVLAGGSVRRSSGSFWGTHKRQLRNGTRT